MHRCRCQRRPGSSLTPSAFCCSSSIQIDESLELCLLKKISLFRREEISQLYTEEKGCEIGSLTFKNLCFRKAYNSRRNFFILVLPSTGPIFLIIYGFAAQDHLLSCNPNLLFLLSHNGGQT